MSSAAPHPNLRLVAPDATLETVGQHRRAELDVVKENRIAAHSPQFDPRDPRWILAMQTHARLQGATLSPERRDELMKSGTRLGLRPFETTLVIALVQDRARSGLPLNDAQPFLRLVRPPAEASKAERRDATWPQWFMAVAAALAVVAALIRWVSG